MKLSRENMLVPLAIALFLGGCTTHGKFPSLARRPQETPPARITPPTATAPQAIALPPAVAAQIAGLHDTAQASHARFTAKRAQVAELVGKARGAAPGSDGWTTAMIALADLSSDRSATATALSELDSLYVAQKIDGDDGGAIAAVRDQVAAWVADEDAALTGLGVPLPN